MKNIELYCGDCLEVMKDIPDKSINLVLIDPPYNIGKDKWDKWKTVEDYVEFMGKVFLEIERILKSNGSFYFFHNDFLQIVELQNFINKNTEFQFKQMLVWNKRFNEASNKGFLDGFCEVNGLRNYQKMCEYILYYTFQDETGLNKVKLDINNFKTLRDYFKDIHKELNITKKEIINKIGQRADHCFRYNSSQWDLPTEETYNDLINIFNINKLSNFRTYESLRQEYESLRQEYESLRYVFNVQNVPSILQHEPVKQNGHLTPKPIKILETLIKTSANENDVVLDWFMGSGSTGVACKHTNRKFVGIEVNEKYFELAKKRIEEE